MMDAASHARALAAELLPSLPRRLMQASPSPAPNATAVGIPDFTSVCDDGPSLAVQQAAAQQAAQSNAAAAFQGNALRLPPHVYLISFILLVIIMSTLLLCHCYRMMRIARRMRRGELMLTPGGLAHSEGGARGAKRGAPRSIVEALPVVQFGDEEGRRAAAAAAAAKRLGRQQEEAAAAGAAAGEQGDAAAAGCAAEADWAAAATAAPVASADAAPAGAVPGEGAAAAVGEAVAAQPSSGEGAAAAAGAEAPSCSSGEGAAGAAAAHTPQCCPDHGACGQHGSCSPEGGPADEGREACAICFEQYQRDDAVKLLPCGHIYHVECIDAWLERDVTCPLCKQAVCSPRELEEAAAAAAAAGAAAGGDASPAVMWRLSRGPNGIVAAPMWMPRVLRGQQVRRGDPADAPSGSQPAPSGRTASAPPATRGAEAEAPAGEEASRVGPDAVAIAIAPVEAQGPQGPRRTDDLGM